MVALQSGEALPVMPIVRTAIPRVLHFRDLSMALTLRHCPLLDRPARTEPVEGAPAPWELRRCTETGFVFLANPPAQERFQDQYAWEVTHEREVEQCGQRSTKAPIRLVDIGCSYGMLAVRVLSRLSSDVSSRLEPVGIEISNSLAKKAHKTLRKHGGRCIHGTAIKGLATLEPVGPTWSSSPASSSMKSSRSNSCGSADGNSRRTGRSSSRFRITRRSVGEFAAPSGAVFAGPIT